MSDRILVVSLVGAVTDLEKYSGEIFPLEHHDIVGLSHAEYRAHDKNWLHRIKICITQMTGSKNTNLDLSLFDIVLVLQQECVDGDPDSYLQLLQTQYHNPNVFIITSGYHSQYHLDKKRIHILPFFLLNVSRFSQLETINPLQNFKKKFDVLLGMSKPHRDFVYMKMIESGIVNDSYLNITTNRFHTELRTIYRSKDLDYVEDSLIQSHIESVLDSYSYIDNRGPRISHIMPWRIYDHSLFSIVTETNWCDYLFLSEKTAKALLARRIFVFFGSAGTLEFIRGFGFRTFDEVIDESYDTISEDHTRFDRAWQQVVTLYRAEPYETFRQCHDILKHNYNHIRNRDYFINPVKIWIRDIISQIC